MNFEIDGYADPAVPVGIILPARYETPAFHGAQGFLVKPIIEVNAYLRK
jgi:hypothetical protein